MVRKIKRIKRAIRVSCDHLEYEDEDGEMFHPRAGQWIDVRKKTSGQDYATMLRFVELADDDGGDDVAAMTAMVDALPEMYTLLAHKIVAWNWTDLWSDDDEPLPPPTVEVMETLDFETDLTHLIGLVMETEETPKN
jgi:hypothetical protein